MLDSKPKILTEQQLAERWELSPKTLQAWRHQGKALPFFKIGRNVRYSLEAVEAFEQSSLRKSTSQTSAA